MSPSNCIDSEESDSFLVGAGGGASDKGTISSGFKLTIGGSLSSPLNHSSEDNVGTQVFLVGGNKSSWKYSLFLYNQIKFTSIEIQKFWWKIRFRNLL